MDCGNMLFIIQGFMRVPLSNYPNPTKNTSRKRLFIMDTCIRFGIINLPTVEMNSIYGHFQRYIKNLLRINEIKI